MLKLRKYQLKTSQCRCACMCVCMHVCRHLSVHVFVCVCVWVGGGGICCISSCACETYDCCSCLCLHSLLQSWLDLQAHQRMWVAMPGLMSTCLRRQQQGWQSRPLSWTSTPWQQGAAPCSSSALDFLSWVRSLLEHTLGLCATGKVCLCSRLLTSMVHSMHDLLVTSGVRSLYDPVLTSMVHSVCDLLLTLSSLKTATAVERIFPFIPENL